MTPQIFGMGLLAIVFTGGAALPFVLVAWGVLWFLDSAQPGGVKAIGEPAPKAPSPPAAKPMGFQPPNAQPTPKKRKVAPPVVSNEARRDETHVVHPAQAGADDVLQHGSQGLSDAERAQEIERLVESIKLDEGHLSKWCAYKERLEDDGFYEFRKRKANGEMEHELWLEECDEFISDCASSIKSAKEELKILTSGDA